MYRSGVVREPCKAENVLFHGGGGGGGEDVAVVRGGDELVSETMVASLESDVSSGSLCSSISRLTDDDAESSLAVVDDRTSSSSDTMLQLDGNGGGPLYELSPLLAHLPVRTGLSKYYQGKSQSFTSLSDAKYVDDLAKKTIPYSSRMKACRGYAASEPDASPSSVSRHVPGPHRKTISKKTTPRGSSHRLLSRVRSTGLMHGSGKPPAYQSKKELYSTYAS